MQPDNFPFSIPADVTNWDGVPGVSTTAEIQAHHLHRSAFPKTPLQSLGVPRRPLHSAPHGRSPFMQDSSASSKNVSHQLPFGPKTLVLGATALIAYGLSRRSKAGTALAAAGGLLAYKAVQTTPDTDDTHAVFLVNASPEQAYKLWRNFAGLPRFMVHLKSVRELDSRRSEWTALGPGQREIRWNAEITEDTPNQRIAWRSLPNSDVQTSGSVEYRADPQGRGTFVSANVQYSLPGGPLTSALAGLFGKN